MNIYKYELKSYLKSIIIWSLSISALLFVFMAFFPSFSTDTKMMDSILKNYPEEMLKAFGMNTGLPLSSIPGYFVFIFAFIQLCISIQASNYGFSFLSIEERELTADFLMSKPVSRPSIFISKLFAAFTALTITTILIAITTFASIEIFKGDESYNVNNMIILLSTIVLFQLFFLSIGMIISVLVKKIRSVLAFSIGLSFFLYILNALKNIIGGDILGLITPFYHFEPSYILQYGKYNFNMTIVCLLIITVSISTSFYLYKKRDIHSL